MWYVIGLIWIALMAAIVYGYNRKQQQRGAERAEKMAALLQDLKANPNLEVAAPAPARPPAAAPAATAVAGTEFSRKPRLLPQSTALLYYVFRTGLPDHEIFAGHTLADVLEIAPALAGAPREDVRRKLAQQHLDLVVCTKQLEVVAVVVTGNHGSRADDTSFIAHCLQAAGIRIVIVDPAAPPRHHEVRALVYN